MEENNTQEQLNRLFIGGIPYRSTEEALKDYFSAAGNVTFVRIMKERDTGRSKGFGFVEMASAEEAQNAIAMFHDKDFEGRPLTVNVANPRAPRTDAAGGDDRPRRAF